MGRPETSVGEPAILVHETLPVKTVRDIARAELGQVETSEQEKFVFENAKSNLRVLDRIANLQSVAVYLSKKGKIARVFSGRSQGAQWSVFEINIEPFEVTLNSETEGSFSSGRITQDRLDWDWKTGEQGYIKKLGSFTPQELVRRVRSSFR
ncbi:hypothetical protein HY382_02560 [Candidatus Curtissbacteria bacterium]|nr:hypothetical protein [Candidatus Curtissbacteria bacterium]